MSRRAFAACVVAASLLAAACSASDRPSTTAAAPYPASTPVVVASPTAETSAPAADFAAIAKLAPHAYTGPCQLDQRANGHWYQQGSDVSELPAPIPCANLRAYVAITASTPTPDSITEVGSVLTAKVTVESRTANYKSAPSDKLIVQATPRAGGSWDVTWSAKPGAHVEWLLVFADGNLVSGASGHYFSRAVGSAGLYVDILANDLDAAAGSDAGITGPPPPAP